MKIGILRETKTPPDKRVPLSPAQCAEVKEKWNVELVVQPSDIRKFQDEAYQEAGITLQEDLSDCDILLGVKEVEIDTLIPEKTYFFFSHTYKMQPYNAKLLRAILDRKIRLVDYEMIRSAGGEYRLIGFGRYAGIVGCYNGFRAYGLKHRLFSLKPAHLCEDRAEMEAELKNLDLPENMKVVLTGKGRVGRGAREILKLLPIQEVKKEDFLNRDFEEAVFTHLDSEDYFRRSSDGGFDRDEFYTDPRGYESVFLPFCHAADMFIACHYWSEDSPFFFTRDDMKGPDWNISVVADISCDIDGPVASTIEPSTIDDPIYGYHRFSEKRMDDYGDDGAIAVMAVDNLPCELPKDASEDFGAELIKNVLPHLLGDDSERIIEKASQTSLDGTLMPDFAYLQDYADGKTTAEQR